MKVFRTVFLSALFILFVCSSGCGRESSVFDVYGASSLVGSGVSETRDTSADEKPFEMIYVDLCGEVADPGVYQLKAGSRLFEAVEKAGGFTEAADHASVNLARVVNDGEQIRVAALGGTGSGDAGSGTTPDGRIDINSADVSLLTQITGIGETRAEAIVAYRDANGPFTKAEDITKVEGIGKKIYENLKDEICTR